MSELTTTLRSHGCGDLRAEDAGKEVHLCGWLNSRRDHGGVVFFDLRDRSGLTQVVAHPDNKEVFEAVSGVRAEFVLRVSGKVSPRPKGTENANLPTGAVEIHATKVEVLNPSEVPPFEISEHITVSEDARLKYRYLDLRRGRMQKNLILRHKLIAAIREYLNERGFIDVETPILTKSTPEGARDFLVPSRLTEGNFYALPQSPQLFKQILMVAGLERYYQIARCFRDEDLRADRQLEFTQLDLEMSYVSEEDVRTLIESLVQSMLKKVFGVEISLPLKRMSYSEAMLRYGSDKPDTRISFEIQELSDNFRQSAFKVFRSVLDNKGAVRALQVGAEGVALSRSEIDDLTKYVSQFGAKGLAWIKWEEAGPNSPIVKFFSPAEMEGLKAKLQPAKGGYTFLVADKEDVVAKSLGALRLELAKRWPAFSANSNHGVQKWDLLWVGEFPAFDWSEEDKRWVAMHHPFTSPTEQGLKELDEAVQSGDASKAIFDPENKVIKNLTARAYDLVLNGTEIGGGSIRIHRPDIQQKVFTMLGISEAEAKSRFGFLLDALKFGAPPHGGIALGLDRICALLCGEDSIREVIAFPKTAKGTDPMTDAPSEVSAKQLKELHIQTAVKK